MSNSIIVRHPSLFSGSNVRGWLPPINVRISMRIGLCLLFLQVVRVLFDF